MTAKTPIKGPARSTADRPLVIQIAAGELTAEVVPELGAGLASFSLAGRPLFRSWSGSADPFDLASILLLPWSNRVSRGGFFHEGQFHALPTKSEAALPLHGNGFELAWSVTRQMSDFVELSVSSEGPGPYRYDATVRYTLSSTGLRIDMQVTNQADRSLPFGMGFHPWLVRTPEARLTANLPTVWLEDSRHLPDRLVPVEADSIWDFHGGRRLPPGWINNAFAWTGQRARLDWPEHGAGLIITASPNLNWAIVYSPSDREDFFCFEPVSHPVDAFWLPGGTGENGLTALRPEQNLSAWTQFTLS